jgi:hypothetical protein
LRALRWTDIDLAAKTLTIERGVIMPGPASGELDGV